jgi:hypothetical protein
MFKLATGAPWHSLTALMPVRRVRRLQTRLYRSGRLAGIYAALHEHLCTEGSVAFEGLAADSSTIQYNRGRVRLVPSAPRTWEEYTTLFLLQRALRNARLGRRHTKDA